MKVIAIFVANKIKPVMKKFIIEMWRDDREGLIGGILIIPIIYGMTWLVSFVSYVVGW